MGREWTSVGLLAAVLLVPSGMAMSIEVLPQRGIAPSAAAADAGMAPAPLSAPALRAQVGAMPPAAVATLALTAEDVAEIQETNAAAPPGKPLKIGVRKPLDVAVDLEPLDVAAMSEQTYRYAGGTVRRAQQRLAWAMRLDALGSGGVRLHFNDVRMPPGSLISIYNDAGDVWGPYQGHQGDFWSHTVQGERLYVQVEQSDLDAGDVSFRVDSAVLIDAGLTDLCGDRASCIEDASDFGTSDWEAIDDVRKAIAHINFISDEGSFICSGGLLSDTDDASSIPYFLTANHCIDDQALAETMETWFYYVEPSIDEGEYIPELPHYPFPPWDEWNDDSRVNGPALSADRKQQCPPRSDFSSTLGASVLDHSAVDDHSLLVLDESPPADSVYLGWTDREVALDGGDLLYRVSHPLGIPQAYSVHRIDTTTGGFCSRVFPRGDYILSRDEIGAVQGGSSGSPVMLADGQVVGQLFGVCGTNIGDVCDAESNLTVDGAFSNYFADVSRWLDPNPEQLPLTVHRIGTGQGRVIAEVVMPDEGEVVQTPSQAADAIQPMIADASKVSVTDWPWQAALTVSTWQLNGESYCGGSVIDSHWILTSASCVVRTVGGRSLTVAPANIQVRTSTEQFEWGGQVSKVRRIVKHPEFDPLTLDNDLALLELKSPVYVDDPIRLVTHETEEALACLGTAGTVTGWSNDTLCGNATQPLSAVETAIVEPAECSDTGDFIVMTYNKICAIKTRTDGEHCQLDRGSPLVVSNGRGGYVQAGIVSEGNGCESNPATAYTRVANYIGWMQQMTGLDLSSQVGPGVIDCGSTCLADYAQGSWLRLTATPALGSTFRGWSGACQEQGGYPICEVEMGQALVVKARFEPIEAE